MKKAYAALTTLVCLLFASGTYADQPMPWQATLQPAATPIMREIRWFEQYTLWFIVPITLFVLILLIVVCWKFRASANPVPSKTSHNTVIEVIWTVGPVLILLFLAVSGTLAAVFIHRCATRATRRSEIWDCGYPDPTAAAQYTSSSFAMPIRRVFGSTVFMVREKVDMPRPGESRASHFHVKVLDPAWRYLYGPSVRAVMRLSVTLNQLQFLTIRSYLTLVFATLVLLLLVVAAWR